MSKSIVLLPGDGIGVEVIHEAEKLIDCICDLYGVEIKTEKHLVGGASLDASDIPVKDEVIEACKKADAVLLGAVGGPKWDNNPPEKRPEKALLRLRKDLGLYNNLRPVTVFSSLKNASPLRPEVVDGVDLLVVRELTGGLYFGQPKEIIEKDGEEVGIDTMTYTVTEIERIAIAAFEAAKGRSKKVTSVDKANILASSQLWRKTVTRIAEQYPEIELEHMLVDNCAMQLIRNPSQFDVILTENMFGDILSDEAAMLTGSIGMLPSASLGDGTGMYEPVHGSAPDIAGKNMANPLATLASTALMFRYSLDEESIASDIEAAIAKVLNAGYNCMDMSRHARKVLSTSEMGEKIIETLKDIHAA
ncbi:3-isopropylmalate dehydrogenase [Balneolaceae bacterium ANBcel3]|nr:3-isopropylmalate dehydrogenase [Balneolaceae bacterium ANBcel3]